MRHFILLSAVLIFCASVQAQESGTAAEAKTLSGMSVLGNNEAPKALVIVPWKSSQIGDGIGVVESLNNRPVPIDREVFARELEYYLISIEDTVPDDLALKGAR